MKKRILAILMIAVLTLGLLAGCGEEEKEPTTLNETETYTITLAHDFEGNSAEVLNTYLTKFTETFPHILVETMKASEVTEENQPNILVCLPERAAELAAKKSLVTLDTFTDADSMMMSADGNLVPMNLSSDQENDMLDVFYEEGLVDGVLYSLPLVKSEQVLYFNQTFFEENMLDMPLSWENLEMICQTIKELDPESIPLCIDDEAGFFVTMFAQHEGDYTSEDGEFLFNNATNFEVAKTFNEWYQKGYVTTKTLMNRENPGSLNATDTRHYIVLGTSGDANSQKPAEENESYAFELGILPFPQLGYENPQVLARGPSLALCQSHDDDLNYCAWVLVRYLVTDIEFQARFAEASGLMPVMESALLEEQYSKYLDTADGGSNISALAALSCLEQQTYLFTLPAFDGASKAYAQMGALLNKCLTITGEDVEGQIEEAFLEAENACK